MRYAKLEGTNGVMGKPSKAADAPFFAIGGKKGDPSPALEGGVDLDLVGFREDKESFKGRVVAGTCGDFGGGDDGPLDQGVLPETP